MKDTTKEEKVKGLGSLHQDKTYLLKHREWRGFKDTMYDFYRWMVTWKDMIKMVLKAPISTVKAIWKYRWMSSYLSAPAFIDRHTEGLRGASLRCAHLHFNMIIKGCTDILHQSFVSDEKINPNNKLSKKTVCVDELIPIEFMAGFPNLKVLPTQTMPIFLCSMVDQLISIPYIDSVESFGVPSDVCPLPAAESGVAIEDDYPKIGKCAISCNMPCDGSVMNSSFLERRLNLPTHVYNVPLRYNGEDVQDYAVKELEELIKFVEEQTGEKFDWDAFFAALENYNKQLDYELKKWEVQRTDYPQMTGATFWLYRLYYYHLSGGFDKRFLKVDKKVNKIMMKGYEKKELVIKEPRHRAIVWSCPANYYTSLATWLLNCWGIEVVMDMETQISMIHFRTDTKEHALQDLAKSYQRTTMRRHTKGGYHNVVDELWRTVEEYNADTVIMYDQISCKGMDGLNGTFDDQARERHVKFIWVSQDLMDPRTVSRRAMRDQVNKYMFSVAKEKPLDPSLVDFDDSEAW